MVTVSEIRTLANSTTTPFTLWVADELGELRTISVLDVVKIKNGYQIVAQYKNCHENRYMVADIQNGVFNALYIKEETRKRVKGRKKEQ